MNKYLVLLVLFALGLVVAACTTEVEVVKEVEVTREVQVVKEVEVVKGVEVIREVQVIATPDIGVAAEPRELTLLAGAGEDTLSVNAFLPSQVTVRVGDTVTWKPQHPDEPHSVTFLSGGERPPGAIPIKGGGPTDIQLNPQTAFPTRGRDAPVETYSGTGLVGSGTIRASRDQTFSLTFDTPGTYEYVCMLHPPMRATITVVDATVADVPSQADIDAMAAAEEAPLRAQIERIVEAGQKEDVSGGIVPPDHFSGPGEDHPLLHALTPG